MPRALIRDLHQLARVYGVQTAYDDVRGRRRRASPEALLAVLKALGAPVDKPADVPAAFTDRMQASSCRALEPVIVAWDGKTTDVPLRVADARRFDARLILESGEQRRVRETVRETHGVTPTLSLPDLPVGYHRLAVEHSGQTETALVLSAPQKAFAPPDRRDWGVFLPLYALHSARSAGAGDLTDLEALTDWTARLGGRCVATLPLLPAFYGEHGDVSPYVPASRLFWNELYIDIERIPELRDCPAARELLASAAAQAELRRLRSAPRVEYAAQWAGRRRVLEVLADWFFENRGKRDDAFRRFLREHPGAEDYAAFRAACEARGPWTTWPSAEQPRRKPGFAEKGGLSAAARYHLFAQWKADEQIRGLSQHARDRGMSWYLDLPLGVHRDSYDTWRYRDAFVLGASGGAPPDAVFTKGQTWGFPPLHPQRQREHRYDYLIACFRHHLRYAGLLRLDHVMSLHRLFFVPEGLEPKDGVYVRYPSDELYAILSLESHRHEAWVVGEDLGTVPSEVPKAMKRHGIHRMYVVQYELNSDRERPLPPVPAGAVASLNTHDMFPFVAYWEGRDIDDRRALGLLDDAAEAEEHEARAIARDALAALLRSRGLGSDAPPDARGVLLACLRYLAASPARLVLVNVEDLWSETEPHNVPGTTTERPNWLRKTRYAFEAFREMPEVLETLRMVDSVRRVPSGSSSDGAHAAPRTRRASSPAM